MIDHDEDLFSSNTTPEPFFALLVGAVTGYVTALLLVLLVFPALNLTVLWGHLLLVLLLLAFGLGGTLFGFVKRWIGGK